MKRVNGIVKWFDDARGFGFVCTDSFAGDIFLHYSQIMTDEYKTVNEGAAVEFDLIVGVKGAVAYNLMALDYPVMTFNNSVNKEGK